MSIPIDVKLTGERSFEKANDGDLAVVDNEDAIYQDPVVRLFNATTPSLADGLTANFITEFEADIENALNQSEYVSPPYEIEVTSVEDGDVTVFVSTAETEFIIEGSNEILQ